jgi:DNA-binding HxlR family transcriptional regulator
MFCTNYMESNGKSAILRLYWDNMETQMDPAAGECPTEATLAVIGGRWKVPILWNLFNGTLRFGELSRQLPAATQKMLTQQLRELERDGLVHRKVFAEIPPKVEYSLTPLGRSLHPVLLSLTQWGAGYLAERRSGQARAAAA